MLVSQEQEEELDILAKELRLVGAQIIRKEWGHKGAAIVAEFSPNPLLFLSIGPYRGGWRVWSLLMVSRVMTFEEAMELFEEKVKRKL